jgi:sarcosine oxidase subunit beta
VSAPARSEYAVAIVGGGIIGLFTALHLRRAGVGPVVVFERGFLSSGASGRNGGGVRQQWETRATIRLARESVQAYRRFGSEFGFNIWFRQGGYLFLAETPEEANGLHRVQEAARQEGLDVRWMDPQGIRGVLPVLNVDRILGGTLLGSDGTLYPFPAVWGVYEAVRRLGVEVRFGVNALGIDRENGRVARLVTSAGPVSVPWVVNAAGGWSGDFCRAVGLESPNVASRHEILATEALKPFLDPMVVRLRDGLYFSQTMRGEVVGGLTVPHPAGTVAGMPSTTRFLRSMAVALTGLLPTLGGLRVLRAWSGFYDDTPDGLPIIGEDPRLPGFVHANGFGGHGFMLAPAATHRVAKAILGEKTDLDPAAFSPARFLRPTSGGTVERIQLG